MGLVVKLAFVWARRAGGSVAGALAFAGGVMVHTARIARRQMLKSAGFNAPRIACFGQARDFGANITATGVQRITDWNSRS